LFVIYFGIALLGVNTSAWISAVVALCLHGSAYYGEIWRGAIVAVPRGQHEAATALGLRQSVTFMLITLPQAVRICLPALVGFSVQLIKGTSLTAIIGFVELTRSAQIINGSVYRPMLIFGLVGALYFALCYPVSYLASRLENKMIINKKGA
jgi:polar amino acid transport system permease protein